ncbi:MAG: zinc-dependent metalloprotease, partial [Rhodothermales bacterium]|nr:zinc-dependent metalloprotease [Rhodothermales bacterium]
LFDVHRIDEQLLFEIPDSLFGLDMLLISRIAQTPANLSGFINAGSKTGEQVVAWERRDNKVLLRKRSFDAVAADSLPIALSVSQNNFEPIVAAFDIMALGRDSAGVVIDVTDFYSKDVPALTGLSQGQRTSFKVRRLDESRSFIDYAHSYPLNVEVRQTMTFEATAPPSNAKTGTISMQMNQSMVLLPTKPMMPRLEDPRVGYFSVSQIDFGLEEQKAAERSYIRRWRLEPKDPAAYARGELVEPVKQIVYYLDPATPEKWRPYFRRGVEDWNEAFETAGFKNAIVARDAPTPEEDPEFSPEDVRYSTVRYVANMTRNATGPSVSDPRSGEIIESDIIWYHNHIRSYRNRLMIETGAANPKARSLMIEEDLIGETMRRVIAHEIGHALGLPHNMIASSSYPVDSLRSPTFTKQYGVAATIMDYARQNYIAQPGDGVTHFIRRIGPYDKYVIDWGYRYYDDAKTPDDEKARLDQMIVDHADNPMYRFSMQNGPNADPRNQTEDMGDDPVKASTYAIANLKRVVPNLVDWTSTPGKDYSDLSEIYGELIGQWNRYVGHVVANIGGVYGTGKASDQEGYVFTPVEADKQRASMNFLAENVFDTPTWLIEKDILRRIENAGAVERIRGLQAGRLNQILDPSRMQRMIETQAFESDAYGLVDLMNDMRSAVWSELGRATAIDTYRRNLQRAYLSRMDYLMNTDYSVSATMARFRTRVTVSQSDIRPIVRAQLATLRREAVSATRRTRDEMTRYHLRDVVERIDTIIEGDR